MIVFTIALGAFSSWHVPVGRGETIGKCYEKERAKEESR